MIAPAWFASISCLILLAGVGVHGQDLSTLASNAPGGAAGGRFVLRHSFVPPFASRQLPFWSHGAGAFVNDSYVRLTPARQSRTGFLWNTVPSTMSDWEISFEFHVSGLPNLGGDGFAFWYTEKSETLGTVYGSTDYWIGLGIFFDTFNNDGLGQNPLISAVYNDGTQKFDQFSDGASQALASCSFDFRNLEKPAAARITYQNQKLTLQIATTRTSDGTPSFLPCFTVDRVDLGVDKYFGLTAHTGDLADNHDIYSFVTKDLSPENVDINAVRSRFKASLTAQQSTPSHQEMSQSEFQHTVLTTLMQLQGELNLMEVSELAISEYLHTKLDKIQTATTSGLPSLIEAKLDQVTLQKVNAISDSNAQILREVKMVQQAVSTVNAAGAAAGSGSNAANVQLSANMEQQFRTLRDTITNQQRKLDDILSQLSRMQQSSQQAAATSYQTAAAGDLGWLSWIMLCITTISTTTVAWYTYKQHAHNARYKMI